MGNCASKPPTMSNRSVDAGLPPKLERSVSPELVIPVKKKRAIEQGDPRNTRRRTSETSSDATQVLTLACSLGHSLQLANTPPDSVDASNGRANTSPKKEFQENLLGGEREHLDHASALSLQNEFNTLALKQTRTGKAWDFTEKVMANHRRLLTYDPNAPDMNFNNFSPVITNDMVFLAEKLFATQEAFAREGKPVHVDIGYHYTKSANIHRIRTDGLLSKAERQAANISSTSNGATYGNGIYTANNPYSYYQFCGGDQGLLVARLKGQTGDQNASEADTVIGRSGKSDEVCVLRSSSQCVALLKFNAPMIELNSDLSAGNGMVHTYHCSLQEIVDYCFNGGSKTPVPKLLPSQAKLRGYSLPQIRQKYIVIVGQKYEGIVTYTAPDTLSYSQDASKELVTVESSDIAQEECTICQANMIGNGEVVALSRCSHQFHQSCIDECIKRSRKCPNCRAPIGVPRGKMPSGSMVIEMRADLTCSGYDAGTLVITYEIGGGVQKIYHENPGVEYKSVCRTAYLPDNQEGRDLLKRLKFAFAHGLTFTVGTSLATGRPNSVTWASIHHKTRPCPGAHGYPDLGYFINTNEELDALHVPASGDL